MEGRNRTIFVVLIAVVIVVAVFSSFGLNLFPPQTVRLELPQVSVPSGDDSYQGDYVADTDRYVRVEITPVTVQSVIHTLTPLQPESYYRTITVRTSLGNGVMGTTVNRVWVDFGWTRVESTWPNGVIEHIILGEGRVYRWFEGDEAWNEWEEGARDVNAAQRIPTYQDVLGINPLFITDAGYEDVDGVPCIFVQAAANEMGNQERYWIAVSSGLLAAAETVQGGEVILSMSSTQTEMPVPPGGRFTLPDGTVLHENGTD